MWVVVVIDGGSFGRKWLDLWWREWSGDLVLERERGWSRHVLDVFHDEGKEGESARSWLGKGMSNYLERGGGVEKREEENGFKF